MIRFRSAPRFVPPAQESPSAPVPLLDGRVVAMLRDGRLRTASQVATALGTAPSEADAALARLAARRQVLRAGHALPQQRGYGILWPTLWGLARPAR